MNGRAFRVSSVPPCPRAPRAPGWTGALLAAGLLAAAPAALRAQATSLTIYSDGRVLVRRTLPVALARGTSTVPVDLGMRDVDAASIQVLDAGGRLVGAQMSAATGLEGSLRRSLGREVVFRTGPDSAPRYVRGTLLSLDPAAVRVDGYVLYNTPGTPVFPDSLVQLSPLTELTLDAPRGASSLSLLYLSGGLSWSASYAVMLPRGGAGQATVAGAAEIGNGASLLMNGVQVQLLAGVVRRVGASIGSAQSGVIGFAARAQEANQGADLGEQAVGGTHVYTLPAPVDFIPGETRVVPLFDRTTADVQPEYEFPVQGYSVQAQWPDALRDQHPNVRYVVRRPAASRFGGTPLPAGTARVFEPDSAGRLQLLGETPIQHTPAGRDLRLTTGTDFDITGTRSQTFYERRGNRDVVSAFRVEIQNAKAQAVTVVVVDACPGQCEVLSSTVPSTPESANQVRFSVRVPARGSAELEYRLRARW